MRWFYILVLTIALTHTVSSQATDPTQAAEAVAGEQKNADRANENFKKKVDELKEAEEKAKTPEAKNETGKLWSKVVEEKKKN